VKLLTVDLESPLPDVPPAHTGEQWVLVRLHREPLGILKFGVGGCAAEGLGRLITNRFQERIQRHLVADALSKGTLENLSSISSACPRRQPVALPDSLGRGLHA
jgi:hypothetical protein